MKKGTTAAGAGMGATTAVIWGCTNAENLAAAKERGDLGPWLMGAAENRKAGMQRERLRLSPTYTHI